MPDNEEALEKPFDAVAADAARSQSKGSNGELQGQPSDAAMRALGVKPEQKPADNKTPPDKKPDSRSPDQIKSDEEGKKLLDIHSAEIQRTSEELYATESYRALSEDGYLDKLIANPNPVAQKMAKKILERNAEHFGASTIEEYSEAKAVKDAGDDPVAQKLAKQELRIARSEKQLKESEWKAWKAESAITPELGVVADQVRKEQPNLSYPDIIHIARGRSGIAPVRIAQKQNIGMHGGLGGSVESEMPSASAMSTMKVDSKLAGRAEAYFKANMGG